LQAHGKRADRLLRGDDEILQHIEEVEMVRADAGLLAHAVERDLRDGHLRLGGVDLRLGGIQLEPPIATIEEMAPPAVDGDM
jgi:hypothetical protein